jgi:hypothetical protein
VPKQRCDLRKRSALPSPARPADTTERNRHYLTVDDPGERSLLLDRLTGQRQHVISQLEGLDDDQLRRPVLPSGWSCLALVRHLTLSDERYWFEVVIDGAPLDFWPEGHNGDWRVDADEPAEAIVGAYRSAIERSDEIITARGLDDAPAQPEEWWESAGLNFPDLRTVLVHVLVETATHAGQLDAVRELLDGRQYLVI